MVWYYIEAFAQNDTWYGTILDGVVHALIILGTLLRTKSYPSTFFLLLQSLLAFALITK